MAVGKPTKSSIYTELYIKPSGPTPDSWIIIRDVCKIYAEYIVDWWITRIFVKHLRQQVQFANNLKTNGSINCLSAHMYQHMIPLLKQNSCYLFQRKQKHIFTFYVIPPHWHDTGCWNPFLCKTSTCLFYMVNIIDADALVTQGLRASATMIFAMLNRINSPHVKR